MSAPAFILSPSLANPTTDVLDLQAVVEEKEKEEKVGDEKREARSVAAVVVETDVVAVNEVDLGAYRPHHH